MPAIGITGGIATGKTTFCECLRKILPAARFFNADHAARQLVDLDQAVRDEVIDAFGADIYSSSGDLNRGRLRAIILQSAAQKSALEKILHPRIRREWSAQAQAHRDSSDFFFADIPLLYETGGEGLCDGVVVVASSPDLQLERLVRRGLGFQPKSAHRLEADVTAEAKQLIEAQMPLEEKIERADHVVWNNDGRAALAGQAEKLVQLWRR